MATHRVGTRFHTQDEYNFCGAAVAMMLFEHLGIAVSQRDFYTVAHRAAVLGSFIDPSALVDEINRRLQIARHAARYRIVSAVSGEKAIQVASASLASLPTLPVFLLDTSNQASHWVLVDGVEITESAGGPAIAELVVHVPVEDNENAVNDDVTPPHDSNDPCGSDGHGFKETVKFPQLWGAQLKAELAFGGTIPVLVPVDAVVTPTLPFGDEVDAHAPLPAWVTARVGSAVSIGDMVTVDGPPGVFGTYQLAPLRSGAGQVGWVVSVGGRRQGIALLAAARPWVPLTDGETVARARAALGTLAAPQSLSRYRWAASRQSRTPFLPFRRVAFSDGRDAHVRIDGATFQELTLPAALA